MRIASTNYDDTPNRPVVTMVQIPFRDCVREIHVLSEAPAAARLALFAVILIPEAGATSDLVPRLVEGITPATLARAEGVKQRQFSEGAPALVTKTRELWYVSRTHVGLIMILAEMMSRVPSAVPRTVELLGQSNG